jgi:hypothetical protein
MNYDLIIAIACIGAVIQETPLWQNLLTYFGLDFKPFNCPLCLTFWTSIPFFIVTTGWWFIFNSIVAAVAAELINKQLRRL